MSFDDTYISIVELPKADEAIDEDMPWVVTDRHWELWRDGAVKTILAMTDDEALAVYMDVYGDEPQWTIGDEPEREAYSERRQAQLARDEFVSTVTELLTSKYSADAVYYIHGGHVLVYSGFDYDFDSSYILLTYLGLNDSAVPG